ncbi:hypothetical protein [Geodermatophilus sp. SYSU D00684]
MRLPDPADLFDLPRTLVESVRTLGAALPRAENLLPMADDVLRSTRALLDGVGPAVARAAAAAPDVVDTATGVVQRLSGVLTPERTAAVAALTDRLVAVLTPDRIAGMSRVADSVRARADVVPRALDALDGLLSSGRLQRLGAGIDRLAAPDRVDRLDALLELVTGDRVAKALDLANDERIGRLLDLAADERIGRLLDLPADERFGRLLARLDLLLADDRLPHVVDRAGEVLDDVRVERVAAGLDRVLAEENLDQAGELLGNGRGAAAVRALLRVGRALTGQGPQAVATLLERLPDLLTEERVESLGALADRAPEDIDTALDVLEDLYAVMAGPADEYEDEAGEHETGEEEEEDDDGQQDDEPAQDDQQGDDEDEDQQDEDDEDEEEAAG